MPSSSSPKSIRVGVRSPLRYRRATSAMPRTRWPIRAEKIQAMSAAPTKASPSAVSGHGRARLQVLADVGERQRDADEGDRRMLHRHGDVQHVDVERVAVALGAARGQLARASTISGRWA